MNPLLADALAIVAPFVIALMTKAQASNRLRSIISIVFVVVLVVATYLGDSHPDEFQAVMAQFGRLIAIIVGVYQAVNALIPSGLNSLLLPEVGLSDQSKPLPEP